MKTWDNVDSSKMEEYASLEPCEVLTEEEWLQGGLTPWVDGIDESSVERWWNTAFL